MATEKTTATYCAVTWCCCTRTKESPYCTVHREHLDLHPMELEPDEELSDGSEQEDCDECKGSGECDCCDGTGEADYKCSKCYDYHTGTCHACDGDGTCPECNGVKTTGVRKKSDKR